jgi:arylsulfatase A-like enzyme
MEKEADPSKPLFLWVHYFDPHDLILTPPESYLDKFESKSGKQRDVLRAKYDAEIRFMDEQLGRLVKRLRKNGFWDKMIVVVVADHGQGLGDHGWWNHGILFQEQIRVPLLIRVPGMRRGNRVPSLVRTIDVMPTVLEAAGVDRSLWPSMDGSTLSGAMRTGRTAEPREAYADSVNILSYGRPDDRRKRDHNSDMLYCLMTDRYKLIYHQLFPDQTQFFDIQEDPGEFEDLANRGLPEMREMMGRLDGLDAYSNFKMSDEPTDPERAERLKQLGYGE